MLQCLPSSIVLVSHLKASFKSSLTDNLFENHLQSNNSTLQSRIMCYQTPIDQIAVPSMNGGEGITTMPVCPDIVSFVS
jgi:hypothetical protein